MIVIDTYITIWYLTDEFRVFNLKNYSTTLIQSAFRLNLSVRLKNIL